MCSKQSLVHQESFTVLGGSLLLAVKIASYKACNNVIQKVGGIRSPRYNNVPQILLPMKPISIKPDLPIVPKPLLS